MPLPKRRIRLDDPNVGALEKKFLAKAIDRGYVSTVGPFVKEFEATFARYCGVRSAVSTQSGTAAIHMSLHEAGIGPGDEVIVPVLTFVATVNPIIQRGATPVFIDVDPGTWTLDVRQVAAALTKRTKAIVPVHLFGNPCDMGPLLALARKKSIMIIEDATESLGATYRGRMTGTLGQFGCFSFNGNKVITTGGGGMVLGRKAKQLEHIRSLVNQARRDSNGMFHDEAGFNYRMTNIEAALGLAQMERLNAFLKKKRLFNALYRRELEGVKGIRFQRETPDAVGAWWLSAIFFERKDAGAVQRRLAANGVPSRRVFVPLTAFPHCAPFAGAPCREAFSIYDQSLCLPSSTVNALEDIKFVCSVIKRTM